MTDRDPSTGRFVQRLDLDTEPAKRALDDWEKESKSTFTELNSAIEVGEKVFGKVAKAIHSLVDPAVESEKATRGLATGLALQGDATAKTLARIQSYNSALEDQIGIDDDAAAALQTKLLTLGVLPGQLERATRATIGLSDATGKDLSRASKEVAKAFKENGERAQELESLFAVSEARAKTYGGETERLHAQWGEVFETLGKVITQSPQVEDLLENANKGVKDLNTSLEDAKPKIDQWFDGFIRGIRKLAEEATQHPGVANFLGIAAFPITGVPGLVLSNAALASSGELAKGAAKIDEQLTLFEKMADFFFQGETDPNVLPPANRDVERRQVKKLDEQIAANEVARNSKGIKGPGKPKREKPVGDVDNQLSDEARELLFGFGSSTDAERQQKALDAREKMLDEFDRIELVALKSEAEKADFYSKLRTKRDDDEKKRRDKLLREEHAFWGQIADIGIQGVAGFITNIAGELGKGGDELGERMKAALGQLLSGLGATLIQIGTAAVIAGTLGEIAPIFKPATGGAIGAGWGAALIGIGAAMVAGGAAVTPSSAAPKAAAAGDAARAGSSPFPQGSEFRGFNDLDNGRGNTTTVIEVNFGRGVVFGTPRQIGRQLGKLLRDAGTLNPRRAA